MLLGPTIANHSLALQLYSNTLSALFATSSLLQVTYQEGEELAKQLKVSASSPIHVMVTTHILHELLDHRYAWL